MKIVYIAHPIGGDVSRNIWKVEQRVAYINRHEPNVVPFAPYLVDLRVLNDDDPDDRARGMRNNEALLRSGAVDELRLYGERLTDGMIAEIQIADDVGVPIVPVGGAMTLMYRNYCDARDFQL